ncbi:hybrid sensor histidine kinase/response regulator [Methanoregula sp.]|uniref:ATP-binding response regulator n=1 Tax=Methanoregula sp. TaxID=2052170 RepID=UPI000CC50F16|nr:response regulator [Methanoregula sp.]PKG33206.1 MAG: hypothetical protein CW742_04170 [Methanoregula sp.]
MLRILGVDDDPALLEDCKRSLNETGLFTIDTATSAGTAMQMHNAAPYDLIFSEYPMPEMNGIPFVKALREQGDTTPFIIFTGRGSEEVVMHALGHGADGYVKKGGAHGEQFARLTNSIHRVMEKREAEERALRQNSDLLAGILRTVPAGIGILKGKIITHASEHLCEMTGYTWEELETTDIHTVWPDAGTFLLPPADGTTRAMDGDALTVETRWQRKDGATLRVILSHGPLYPAHPEQGTIICLFDVTMHMMADDALRMANKKLNLLSSITRHDILNKISIIDSNIIFIQKRNPPKEIDPFLLKIGTTTRAIQTQIEFSRVYQDLGSTDSRWQKIDSIMPRRMVPEGVQFQTTCGEIEVFADPMLQKVFFNLFDNSLRHGGHVHQILVSCREGEGGLKILWEDDGIGIPDDEKERVFERGYGKNTGLGLFLVREILGITGITIRETGTPGKGAIFEISIPRGVYRFTAGKKG